MVIGISGKIYAGKDATGKIIQSLLQKQDDTDMGFPTYEIKKFKTKIVKIASLLTGIAEELFEDREFKDSYLPAQWNDRWMNGNTEVSTPVTIRQLLQRVGTDAIRDNLHEDTWVNALFADYKVLSATTIQTGPDYFHRLRFPDWIITDVRFPNEAKRVKDHGGLLIRVDRPDQQILNHETETALDSYDKWDGYIHNNGTLEDLQESVKDILHNFKLLDDNRSIKNPAIA